MRTNILRSVALTLGIGACGIAQAQYGGYPSGPATPNGYQTSNGYQPGYPSQPVNGYGGQGYSSVPVHPSLRALPPAPSTTMASQQAVPGSPPAGFQLPNNYQSQPAYAPQAAYPQPGGYPASNQPAPARTPYQTVSSGHEMPIGSGSMPPLPAAQPMGIPQPMPMQYQSAPAPGGDCQSCNAGSIYQEAAAAPWIGSAPIESCGPAPMVSTVAPIRNWFAGTSLLFMELEEDCDRRLIFPDAMPTTTMMRAADVAPGSTPGFETYFGHYFGCGKYALSASYFYLNPDLESRTVMPPAAGDYRAAMPLWDRMYIDRDGDNVADDVGAAGPGDDHLYGVFDAATDYRIRRNVEFQGVELNFVSFAIGGAARVGVSNACGPCGTATAGCGGMGGPMMPSCNSRVQLQLSHGIRWFRFKDDFELAASATDMIFGSGIDDYYYNIETENDLIGYQFGGRVSYAVTCRLNLFAGGKFGLYGNNVDYHSRIGTRGAAAQVTAAYPTYQDMRVDVNKSETVMSSLGELDLGLGYRITNCWTLTGGYRMLGITGVATSVGNISDDPAHLVDGHLNCINDSILLHGGYVGLQYNW